ncbi:hypothetical protein BC781_10490 [Sediminitomix flava]|uniref:Coenzyme PQQ synthesis protein D (PqqD) n=2 Tax=Sediminitomix flava TaxID=379075 RepID=A0A315Z7D7_SEDFL|nr:hypothetical protein BC781_10490 [Sediminitomix flava]
MTKHDIRQLNVHMNIESNNYKLVSNTNEIVIGKPLVMILNLLQEGKSINEIAHILQYTFPSVSIIELEHMIKCVLDQLEQRLCLKEKKSQIILGTSWVHDFGERILIQIHSSIKQLSKIWKYMIL